ncbi:MAG: S8 family serine peptidase [Alphaproteobacteria bacterium]|nr:S8 family serine peptidase [Alphaproteobacteria bacterium]
MRLFRLYAVLLVSILLCAPWTWPAAADAGQKKIILEPRTDSTDLQRTRTAELLAEADSDGRLSLIVGLAVDPTAAGAPSLSLVRLKAIAEVQASLARRLSLANRQLARLRTLPYVVMRLRTADLPRLIADPAVLSIENDLRLQIDLRQSTNIIRAKQLQVNYGITGENQVVAILDTGVDSSHPMLAGKVIAEACFSSKSPSFRTLCPNRQEQEVGPGSGADCPAFIKGCEHGTHVASIAAGRSSNLSGVAPDAEIIAVQVASKRVADGGGCSPAPCAEITERDLFRGLDFVNFQRLLLPPGKTLAAVNISLGIEKQAVPCDGTRPYGLLAAIKELRRAGIATVIAAGNNGYDGFVSYPACLSEAIAVGASDDDDKLWVFSNLGPLTKLLAPGVDILAAIPKASQCPAESGRFCELSGTSQAAPHVTGAWALLKSAVPASTVSDVLDSLNCTGRPVQGFSAFHSSNKIHRPRVNVLAAYSDLKSPDSDRHYYFSLNRGPWHDISGTWFMSGGALQTETISWPVSSPWGITTLDFCRAKFSVQARMKQLDPAQPTNYPLETGLLLASHITRMAGETRTSGYAFLIRSAFGNGHWAVKRIEDKLVNIATLSDESTLCSGDVPGLKLDRYHQLRVDVDDDVDGSYKFFLDGNEVCTLSRSDHPPRYAPPAEVALVARRGVGGFYRFIVDEVQIITP